MSFEVGARVETEKTGKGRVAFCGEVQFAEGEWVGVILDEPRGKNNGTVQGVQYFTCEPNYGLFIRPTQLKPESARARTSGLKTPVARKDVAQANKGARSSPGGSPKVSPSVSLERLSKAPGPKKVLSSSRLADSADPVSSAIICFVFLFIFVFKGFLEEKVIHNSQDKIFFKCFANGGVSPRAAG
ncbi:hypothetical protein Y032_0506g2675 [Ancylostoma ceylanicum]|uniref:CAP-Gly domain-containing protein n=1 Tax=Ancylostoma ceylanicum TaxID=53326 RepID=A0A016WTP4_9BILA|nr:hypothetical protein Y032_0506g2675 [Ancylostoma ceylanicum]